ncbi:hypothetical protein SAMN02745127_01008 [Oceanospirillum multiglobuliferum]|uniref:hypothetical protein n=1 Tax=Oceanospirillum multiglobuliferum TaxID=64969 RepID=UPI0009D1814A|nr:hypothetical protein [Oceanospirillum multiglobuliferum]SJZ74375.1 hypothetical protein SAMN02745127_01008 [Oceanospirillum multiglobuliferum]
MINSVPRIPSFYFWIVLSFAIFKPIDTLVEPSPIAFDNAAYFSLLDSGDSETSLLTHWRLPALIYSRIQIIALNTPLFSTSVYAFPLVRAPPLTHQT